MIRSPLRAWRAVVATLAGLALGLAFPTPGWMGLAWVAPAMLLLATAGLGGRKGFALGLLAGSVHHLVSLRWLLAIPFPAGAWAAWISLSLYMALYTGLWVWMCWRLLPRPAPSRGRAGCPQPAEGGAPGTARSTWEDVIGPVVRLPWTLRTLWALGCATAWVTTEMVSAHLFSGFPWNPLGVSQHPVTPLIQLASVTGVPGISFLVVWGSVAAFVGIARQAWRLGCPALTGFLDQRSAAGESGAISHRMGQGGGPGPRALTRPSGTLSHPTGEGWGEGRVGGGLLGSLRFAMLTDIGLPLLVTVGVTLWGALQLAQPTATAREVRLALVQPSIPQRLIWDPRETTNRFNRLMELSALALATRPDALVWPEASLPEVSEAGFQALTNLVASHGAWLIFGAEDAEWRPGGGYDSFNSAFLFGPDGRLVETYRKQRLVIFGEYIPFERWVPWVRYLTPIDGSFAEGKQPVPFRLSAPRATLSVLICFEDVFARGARRHVADDTDFLLNLTNDGWFGEGAAQWQHAVHAAFRAVENGVPLVRCTNNGLTCWVDEHGRIREGIGLPDGNIYGAGFIHVRVPLPGEGAQWQPTFYRRHGDVFGWGCCVLCGLGLAGRYRGGVSPACW